MPEPEDPINDSDTKKETNRLLIGACIVTVIVLIVQFTPIKQWLASLYDLKEQIDGYGWKAHAIFIAGSILGIAIGFPRLALCGLGGVLFGFWEGLLASQFASVAGSYGSFLLTRLWAPKQWVERKLEGSERLRKLLAHPSIASIFIARQLPVPGLVPNVLLGALNTRHSTFLIGTFLGYLPSNIPVASAGSSVGKESLSYAIWQASMSMFALGIFSMLIMWIRRKYRDSV